MINHLRIRFLGSFFFFLKDCKEKRKFMIKIMIIAKSIMFQSYSHQIDEIRQSDCILRSRIQVQFVFVFSTSYSLPNILLHSRREYNEKICREGQRERERIVQIYFKSIHLYIITDCEDFMTHKHYTPLSTHTQTHTL